MDHDWAVGVVVRSCVVEVKPLREVVVDLDGPELPFAANDVLYDEVDLGAVKGGLSGFFRVRYAEFLNGETKVGLGFVPVFGFAYVF